MYFLSVNVSNDNNNDLLQKIHAVYRISISESSLSKFSKMNRNISVSPQIMQPHSQITTYRFYVY